MNRPWYTQLFKYFNALFMVIKNYFVNLVIILLCFDPQLKFTAPMYILSLVINWLPHSSALRDPPRCECFMSLHLCSCLCGNDKESPFFVCLLGKCFNLEVISHYEGERGWENQATWTKIHDSRPCVPHQLFLYTKSGGHLACVPFIVLPLTDQF